MGLHAFAILSRFSGALGGHVPTIQEDRQSSSSISIDPDRVSIAWPEDFEMPPGGLHPLARPPLEQEARDELQKWYAAMAMCAPTGSTTTSSSLPRPLRHHRQRQGLQRRRRPCTTWARTTPPAPHRSAPAQRSMSCGRWRHSVREFVAQRGWEILVVEEKRQIIEYQV